jgi:hypothetical protein
VVVLARTQTFDRYMYVLMAKINHAGADWVAQDIGLVEAQMRFINGNLVIY